MLIEPIPDESFGNIAVNMKNTILEFEWDNGNSSKNFDKHHITILECESCFADENGKDFDTYGTGTEIRGLFVGVSFKNVLISTVYTIRNGKIRIISTRPSNKKESKKYFGT